MLYIGLHTNLDLYHYCRSSFLKFQKKIKKFKFLNKSFITTWQYLSVGAHTVDGVKILIKMPTLQVKILLQLLVEQHNVFALVLSQTSVQLKL